MQQTVRVTSDLGTTELEITRIGFALELSAADAGRIEDEAGRRAG